MDDSRIISSNARYIRTSIKYLNYYLTPKKLDNNNLFRFLKYNIIYYNKKLG